MEGVAFKLNQKISQLYFSPHTLQYAFYLQAFSLLKFHYLKCSFDQPVRCLLSPSQHVSMVSSQDFYRLLDQKSSLQSIVFLHKMAEFKDKKKDDRSVTSLDGQLQLLITCTIKRPLFILIFLTFLIAFPESCNTFVIQEASRELQLFFHSLTNFIYFSFPENTFNTGSGINKLKYDHFSCSGIDYKRKKLWTHFYVTERIMHLPQHLLIYYVHSSAFFPWDAIWSTSLLGKGPKDMNKFSQ